MTMSDYFGQFFFFERILLIGTLKGGNALNPEENLEEYILK